MAQIFALDYQWIRFFSENWPHLAKYFAQLAILVVIIYFVYNRFIRRSHAEQLVKGLFVTLLLFVALWGLARLLQFNMLEVVFYVTIQLLMIGLIVIFQPELRRMLLYLGQPEFFSRTPLGQTVEERKAEFMIRELSETVHFLSKSKTGALIVLESPTSSGGNYLEAGTALDARLSTELLLTIFHPKTPLHDGAVVINADNRIAAAGVLLPLTEDPKLSWQYGTRHRAAIGLTETSDSRCIVVSEETGTVSLVQNGTLEKMASAEDLKKRLEKIYHVQSAPRNKLDGSGPPETGLAGLLAMEVIPDSVQKFFSRRAAATPTEEHSPTSPGDH